MAEKYDNERELIKQFMKTDRELKKLFERHLTIEERLTELGSRSYLTSLEESEARTLKRKKLVGRDKMMAIIRRVDQAA